MDMVTETTLREQLVDRRRRLEGAITEAGEAADLVRLLREVDGALKRMDAGGFGLCEVCHEDVGEGDLAANPLIQYCLCSLTAAQQRTLQNDLELAARIQWALLPKQNLIHGGWSMHYRYLPAGPVSGDYCDVVTRETDGRSLHFMVGDVSGKGVAASFVMAHLNALFRSLIDMELPVPQVVERANRLLIENHISSHYATLVCGKAEATGEVEICNAGHCRPFVIRQGDVSEIEATGFPVGLFSEKPYAVSRVKLEPGETLVLYTDGLTEARDPSQAEYGVERLASVLGRGRGLAPGRLAASCLEDLSAFLGGGTRTDDLTLMVVRRAT